MRFSMRFSFVTLVGQEYDTPPSLNVHTCDFDDLIPTNSISQFTKNDELAKLLGPDFDQEKLQAVYEWMNNKATAGDILQISDEVVLFCRGIKSKSYDKLERKAYSITTVDEGEPKKPAKKKKQS